VSLIDTFSDYETKYGSGEIYKFKRIFDQVTPSKDYDQMKFDMRVMFAFVDALGGKNVMVDVDERTKEVSDLEFNPTLSVPNITFRDKLGREFAVWYKPLFYYPNTDSVRPLVPDFVVLKTGYGPLYNLDEDIKKTLWTEKFFTGKALLPLTSKLLNKLKPVHLAVFIKRKYTTADLTKLKAAAYFLRPNKMLAVSQEEMSDHIKMNLPISTYAVGNVYTDMERFKETVRRII